MGPAAREAGRARRELLGRFAGKRLKSVLRLRRGPESARVPSEPNALKINPSLPPLQIPWLQGAARPLKASLEGPGASFFLGFLEVNSMRGGTTVLFSWDQLNLWH